MSLDYFSTSDWVNWSEIPITKEFFKILSERRVRLLDEQNSHTDVNDLAKDYFMIKGQISGLDLVVEQLNERKELPNER